MVPEFDKAVWELEVGTITPKPIKTQFGYHVIYLDAKNPAKTIPYDEVKDKIITSLKQKEFSTKVAQVAKELRGKATVVIMSDDKKENKKDDNNTTK